MVPHQYKIPWFISILSQNMTGTIYQCSHTITPPQPHGACSCVPSQTIAYHRTVPSHHRTIPSHHRTVPSHHRTVPSHHRTIAPYHRTIAPYHRTVPVHHCTAPSHRRTKHRTYLTCFDSFKTQLHLY